VRFISYFLTLTALASPVQAAYASRDLFLPVYGRGVGGDGRRYETSLLLTNPNPQAVDVRLSFLRVGQPNLTPRKMLVRLTPNETRVLDPPPAELLGSPDGFGALHVEGDRDVVAHARLYSDMPGEPLSRSVASSFNAIPSQFAVGTNDEALLQGATVSSDFRVKLYFVETTGQPLVLRLALLDATGRTVATKHQYLGPRDVRSFELGELFPKAAGGSVIRLGGMNGNGRAIVAGAQIAAESQDGTAYEMSFTTAPRWRMPPGEIAAYIAAAAAIITAILVRRRSG
jgi:hypothetical protein